jgi:glycosyltransferase involved in cell wall biosynthesis
VIPAKKILFISYNAQRSGAAMLLLNLTQAIKDVSGYEIDLLFRHGGELLDKFKAVGNVTCIHTDNPGIVDKVINKLTDKTAIAIKKILSKNYDAVIINTVLNADILPAVKSNHRKKIISYIHELKVAIESLTNAQSLSALLSLTDVFIVPSETVKKLFVNEYNIHEKKIYLLPYCAPSHSNKISKSGIHTQFTVGGCGTVEMRKGTDLFIQLAEIFSKKYPDANVQFAWLGGSPHSLEFKLLSEDIKKLDLHNVKLMPATDDVITFYYSLDVLVLTSREDPYPLVMLEAADAGVPTICFDKAGGASEFVNGNGKIVNYLDLEQMAAFIHEYYMHPALKTADGIKAKAKLAALHQHKKEIVQQFLEIIQ